MKPRFRVVSEDGITTHVYDLETGEDLAKLLTGVQVKIEQDVVEVSMTFYQEAVAVDVAATETRTISGKWVMAKDA